MNCGPGEAAKLCSLALALSLHPFLPSRAMAQAPSYPWLDGAAPLRTIERSVPTPSGSRRRVQAPGTFADWLRHLPLKSKGAPVRLYDGRLKPNQLAHWAVIEMDTGRKNLMQCADAIIRLRAEYLWSIDAANEIEFQATSGDPLPWSKWAGGWRPRVQGNRLLWRRIAAPDWGRSVFRRYLDAVFIWAGSISLERDTQPRAVPDLSGGDILVQPGSPGHAVIVLDLADDPKGNVIMLLGQSYMPAQEFHVLRNPGDPALSPWYRVSDLARGGVRTPEWRPFLASDLRSFR